MQTFATVNSESFIAQFVIAASTGLFNEGWASAQYSASTPSPFDLDDLRAETAEDGVFKIDGPPPKGKEGEQEDNRTEDHRSSA